MLYSYSSLCRKWRWVVWIFYFLRRYCDFRLQDYMGHWITTLFVFELWTSKFNMNIDIIMFLIRRTMKTSLWKKVNCTNTLKKRKARGHQLLSMLLSKRRHHVQIIQGDLEAETPILWLPDAKSWLIEKHPDAGKDWGQEEKGKTEDGMVGWHHQLNGHGFGWTPGVGDG